MQLTNSVGQAVDIPSDEIARAATALGWSKIPAHRMAAVNGHTDMLCKLHEHAEKYMNKALDSIQRMTNCRPKDQPQMKKFMYNHLPLGSQDDTNLNYQCIQAILGWFAANMLEKALED